MTTITSHRGPLTLAMALLFFALPASAQPAPRAVVDPRWAPWLGCWQLATERRPGSGDAGGLDCHAGTIAG